MKTTLIRAVVFMSTLGSLHAQQNSGFINYTGLEESFNPAHFTNAQVKADLVTQQPLLSKLETPLLSYGNVSFRPDPANMIGVRVYNESYGWTNMNHIQIGYAHKFSLGRRVLSAGVSLGQNRFSMKKNEFPDSPAPQQTFTQSAGLTLSDKADRAKIGVSVTNFPEFKSPVNVDGVRLLNLYGDYKLVVGAGKSYLRGAFYLTTDLANTSLLLDLNVYPTEKYYIGAGIRFNNYALLSTGIRLSKSFLLNISYGRTLDQTFSPAVNLCQLGLTYRRERKHIRIRIKLQEDADL